LPNIRILLGVKTNDTIKIAFAIRNVSSRYEILIALYPG